MKNALLFVMLAAPLAAQTEGVVIDALTGAPLPGAYVSVVNGMTPAVTRTDAAGHFSIEGTPLQIARTGYVDATNVQPAKGHETTIRLAPAAAIAGKLEDQDGFPVAGAQVDVMQYRDIDGERRLYPANMTRQIKSNDLGEYRIGGLPAGKYYLRVSGGTATNWDRRYPAQFYGGTVEPKDENRIEVKAGEQHDKLDIRLIQYDGVTVSGHIEGMPRPVPGVMSPPPSVRLQGDAVAWSTVFSGVVQNDGTFVISNVISGKYTLVAESGLRYSQPGGLLGKMPVEVGASGLSGLTVALHTVQAVDVAGTFVVDGGGTPPPMTIRLQGGSGTVGIKSLPDGSFVLKGLLPAHYSMSVMADFRFTSRQFESDMVAAMAASTPLSAMLDEKDVLQKGFDVDSQPIGPLKITLGQPIKLTGKVVDASGQPVAGAALYIKSDQYLGGAMTDGDGAYLAYLRTAGIYRVYLLTDPNLSPDSDYLKAHENDFPAISVGKGENPPAILHWTGK
jgi:protocatechuate 3,4-dioxygenase beta subunit